MTTLILIRHGQNDFVGKHRLAGWMPGVHLNAVGQAQAQALARALGQVKLQAVYASPLERTMETAQPIAAAHNLEVRPREGLGELKIGRWEGRTLKSLRGLKAWKTVQQTPSLARFPGGESFAEAQARMVAALEAIRAEHHSKKSVVACVSHSDMIKLAVAHYLGLPLDLFQRIIIDPGSMTVLMVGSSFMRLIRLNDGSAVQDVKPQ